MANFRHPEKAKNKDNPIPKKPPWIRVKAPNSKFFSPCFAPSNSSLADDSSLLLARPPKSDPTPFTIVPISISLLIRKTEFHHNNTPLVYIYLITLLFLPKQMHIYNPCPRQNQL